MNNRPAHIIFIVMTYLGLLIGTNSPGIAQEPGFEQLTTSAIRDISSSSVLDNHPMWHHKNIMDGSKRTPWVPNKKGVAKGEWIQITFKQAYTIEAIALANGFAAHEKSYQMNNRIKRAILEFSDGSRQSIELEDHFSFQNIRLNGITTSSIKVIIEEIYPGNKYPDTCLSEIKIYVKPFKKEENHG